MPAGIEWGHELVTMAGGARGKFLRAGQVEPDALEHMRQRRHVPTSRLAGSRRWTPADAGSLLQWERGTLTLRKAHRIADRSYFGHGPDDKAGRSGQADATRAKQHSQSRLDIRRLRTRMPLRPVTLRQRGEDARRREHIDQDPARAWPRIAIAFRPPSPQRFAVQREHGIWLPWEREHRRVGQIIDRQRVAALAAAVEPLGVENAVPVGRARGH